MEGNKGHFSVQGGEWRGSVCARRTTELVPKEYGEGNGEQLIRMESI